MRLFLLALALAALFQSGCARHSAARAGAADAGPSFATVSNRDTTNAIVSAERILVGKVVRVNAAARFVVLNFPVGHLPAPDQAMGLFRGGVRVGDVKVTGPQLDDNIVADLVAGDAQPGDDARER